MPTAVSFPRAPRPARGRRLLALALSVAPLVALSPHGAFAAPGTVAAPPPVPAPAAAPPAGLELAPSYVGANSCDYTVKPGVARFASLIQRTYVGTGSYGIVNTCAAEGSVSEHTEGRAWDWAVSVNNPAQVAQVNALFSWLLAPDAQGRPAAHARRLGLMYMIWDRHILGVYNLAAGWRPYSCSGVTGCHQDHVHFSLTWAGARGVTSYWTGTVAPNDYGPCSGPGQMFARPTGTAPPTPCPSSGVLAPSDPVVAALRRSPDTVLQVGSTGPAVAAVQQAIGGTTADGDFGQGTRDLVLTYQERRGLSRTGTVTRAFVADLISHITGGTAQLVGLPAGSPPPVAPAPTVGLSSYRTQVLQLGSTGPAVQALQKALGITSDGDFGPQTVGAVQAFQRAHSLAATGIVTTPMWDALIAGTKTPVPVPVPVPVAVRPAPPVVVVRPAPPVIPAPRVVSLSVYRAQVLKLGSTGPAVRALQQALHITSDGAFGPHTLAAVQAFQRAHHLPATGIVTTVTWNALIAAATPPRVATPPRPAAGHYVPDATLRHVLIGYDRLVLRTPASGPAVVALQRALRIPADGAFGPQTLAAVQAFQRSHHLPATGVVTLATWLALAA